MDKQRNLGIDLLRIVSMFMVVMLHVIGQGGILKNLSDLSIKSESIRLIEIICFCAVNCFAIISGYVGINSKHRYSSIIKLWIEVFFYSLFISVSYNVYLYATSKSLDFMIIIKSFFPVIIGENWYFSAYFCLFFFMPLLNFIIVNLEKKQLNKILIISFILFSIFETIISNINWGVNAGYSFLWLAYMYFIGAYLSKYKPFERISIKKCLCCFIVCILLTFMSRLGIALLTLKITGEVSSATKFVTYVSPLYVIAAVALVEMFSRFKINKFGKVIALVSSTTFGVFILHTNKIIYRKLLLDRFSFLTKYNLLLVLFMIIVISCLVFVLCSIIDWIRNIVFKWLKVNKLSNKISDFIENKIG